ncbi:MAG: hypothetical protein LBI28_04385 [Treponema sp.]|nr:hypothetical protein [Treponema sp.]
MADTTTRDRGYREERQLSVSNGIELFFSCDETQISIKDIAALQRQAKDKTLDMAD